jgi:hypothetical protein
MRRHQVVILLAVVALIAFVAVGRARAEGNAGDAYGGEEVGKVWFIDRSLDLVQLDNGTEFRVTDQRQLAEIQEGMWVKIDYTHTSDRNIVNSIEPTDPNAPVGPTPSAEGTITLH